VAGAVILIAFIAYFFCYRRRQGYRIIPGN
jgi:hypothetical protein